MKSSNYTTSFVIDQTPEEAFAATNNVRGWRSGNIEGSTNKLGDEWTGHVAFESSQGSTKHKPPEPRYWTVYSFF